MKILMTGGSGLLCKHLKIEADRPTHQKLDITQAIKPKNYDLIIHCAAYTSVEKAEIEREKCFDVNFKGTVNLLKAYPATPFVFISTEYADCPINFYSISKRMAEDKVKEHPKYLIIRTLFKATPWKYETAFIDQWTTGDQVEIIVPLIEQAINDWDKTISKLMYIGTGRKRIYDIAVKSKPNVIPNLTTDIKTVRIPTDYD